MISKLYITIIAFNTLLYSVYGQTDVKSSLTFVIDNTLSMSYDINTVKLYADKIFDAVINSKDSQIDHFVIVTFQDPAYKLRVVTTKRDDFKKTLFDIQVSGGGDCSEMVMSAIELGLLSSRPHSYLFVFTDATAKDYYKLEKVKHLALDLNTRIMFLITNIRCNDEKNFKRYEILAQDTDGEYFQLTKDGKVKILNYVENLMKVRKTKIISHEFTPEKEKKLNFTLDSAIEVIDVSVTGSKPSIIIRDGFGNEVKTNNVLDIAKRKVISFDNKEPGSYNLEVESKTNTLVTIYGSSKITFEYGFSIIKPSSLNDISNLPIADKKSFLAIKINTNGKKFILKTMQFLNLKGNTTQEVPIKIDNVEDQFYISEPTIPPNNTFKIVITAENAMTEESIKRVSLPVEPQRVFLDSIEKKAPTLDIIGEKNIIFDYGKPLQLKCYVTGYPEPNITWEDEYGSPLMFKVAPKKLPYEYITVLDIDQITINNSFICKARNDLGNAEKTIKVGLKTFYTVINISKDKAVEYKKTGTLFCKVKSYPPANIIWYQNGKEIKSDDDINISLDGTTLNIKHMRPKFVGKYLCEVRNDIKRYVYKMQLSITGVEAPEIYKNVTELSVIKGSNVNILCRILKGNPKPAIEWLFRNEHQVLFHPILHEHYENLLIDNVTSNMIGTYKCVARNDISKDSHVTDLIVDYAPIIKSTRNVTIIKIGGETVTIPCPAEGAPKPKVTWFLNKTVIEEDYPYRIYRNNTISFKASVDTIGKYTCEAKNKLGMVQKTAYVSYCEPVTVNIPKETILKVKVGTILRLTCKVKGYPTPTIKWSFINSTDTVTTMYKLEDFEADGSLLIPVVQLTNKGFYICSAENCGGHRNLTYNVLPHAPPVQTPIIKQKNINAVDGDIVLRIPCLVTGEPKPKILWKKDSEPINIESEWYSLGSDDTLIIKNLKKSSSGTYICAANNEYGAAYAKYNVEVHQYPKETGMNTKIFVESNSSKEIQCNVPHNETDSVRWYKSTVRINEGNLKLTNVGKSHSGLYKCRVSNYFKSSTGSVYVKVGHKPKFIEYNNPTKDEISHKTQLFDDVHNFLNCVNEASPSAKITWRYNNNRIDEKEMIHKYENKVDSQGEYVCIVENEFGKLERKFIITSDDCLLNIKADLDRYHPLILTMGFQLPEFYVKDEHLAIPQNTRVQFFCNEGFNKFSEKAVQATCAENKSFKIQGSYVDYPKLKCKEPLQPFIIQNNITCTTMPDGEFYDVGVYGKDLLEVYKICFHKGRKIPLYAEYKLSSWAAGVISGTVESWFNNDKLNYNRIEMYDCKIQKKDISLTLGRPFHNEDNMCFTARQLVNEKDVPPGFPQMLTHSYLNIIPHWNSINMKYWDALEELLRSKTKKNNFIIRTGISQNLELPSATSDMKIIKLKDKAGNTMTVPVFLWKVITDTNQGASAAIIQLNLPDTILNLNEYVICPDICKDLKWMYGINKNDIKNGLMYCCTIYDFENAFGYHSLFSRGYTDVLIEL